MSQKIFELSSFKWIDCTNPSNELLAQSAEKLGLPKRILDHCLDSDYLPHIETYGDVHFVILRLMEPKIRKDADSIQELTTKIALFLHPSYVITLHRLPLAEVSEIEKKLVELGPQSVTREKLISLFLDAAISGFDKPLIALENELEDFEEKIFQPRKTKSMLLEGYYIKRRASAFKKVLKFTTELSNKLVTKSECSVIHVQELKDRLERNLFYAENVFENVQAILNLHMSIESQRTNEASFKTSEIMRILTVLSIFFLPLNFLAGVFGMNFQHIPLLDHPYGFWFSILFMVLISFGLVVFVLRQGWIEKLDMKSDMKSDKD